MKIEMTFDALVNPQPETLVVCCVDPKYLGFRQLIIGELKLTPYVDAVIFDIAGGLAPLACRTRTPSRFKQLARQLRFKCKKFPIRRIVGIAHKGCGDYDTIPESHEISEGIEKRDLELAGGYLLHLFPDVETILYHAQLVGNGANYEIETVDPRVEAHMKETVSLV